MLGLLLGCTSTAPPPTRTVVPSGAATLAGCKGAVQALPGTRALERATVPPFRLGGAGQGRLCTAGAFVTERETRLYRVYGGGPGKAEKMGGYWTADPPTGTEAAYRRENVICQSFNALTEAVVCKVRPGVTLFVGPGQSASRETCTDPREPRPAGDAYEASAVNQVAVVTRPGDTPGSYVASEIDEKDCEPYPLPWR